MKLTLILFQYDPFQMIPPILDFFSPLSFSFVPLSFQLKRDKKGLVRFAFENALFQLYFVNLRNREFVSTVFVGNIFINIFKYPKCDRHFLIHYTRYEILKSKN